MMNSPAKMRAAKNNLFASLEACPRAALSLPRAHSLLNAELFVAELSFTRWPKSNELNCTGALVIHAWNVPPDQDKFRAKPQ